MKNLILYEDYTHPLNPMVSDLFGFYTGTLICLKSTQSRVQEYFIIVNNNLSKAKEAFIDSFLMKKDRIKEMFDGRNPSDSTWEEIIKIMLSTELYPYEIKFVLENIEVKLNLPYFDSFESTDSNIEYLNRKFNYPFANPKSILEKIKDLENPI